MPVLGGIFCFKKCMNEWMSGGGRGGGGLYVSCGWTGCGGGEVVCDYLAYLVAYTHLRLMNLIPYSYVTIVPFLLGLPECVVLDLECLDPTYPSRDTPTE